MVSCAFYTLSINSNKYNVILIRLIIFLQNIYFYVIATLAKSWLFHTIKSIQNYIFKSKILNWFPNIHFILLYISTLYLYSHANFRIATRSHFWSSGEINGWSQWESWSGYSFDIFWWKTLDSAICKCLQRKVWLPKIKRQISESFEF